MPLAMVTLLAKVSMHIRATTKEEGEQLSNQPQQGRQAVKSLPYLCVPLDKEPADEQAVSPHAPGLQRKPLGPNLGALDPCFWRRSSVVQTLVHNFLASGA